MFALLYVKHYLHYLRLKIMQTIKIKLPFSPEKTITERKVKLMQWAKTMIKTKEANILEEKHLERMSYIVVGS